MVSRISGARRGWRRCNGRREGVEADDCSVAGKGGTEGPPLWNGLERDEEEDLMVGGELERERGRPCVRRRGAALRDVEEDMGRKERFEGPKAVWSSYGIASVEPRLGYDWRRL